MKKICISVSNDMSTDARVQKVAETLSANGFQVQVIGIKRSRSVNFTPRDYRLFKMNLIFQKEVFFYAELQIRLFFQLLFRRTDILYANDLDTLLPNFLLHKIKRIPLIYDSHEYFTEVPELKEGSLAKKTWQKIEKFIFPKLKYVLTVCDSIARIYETKYKVQVQVMRNLPPFQPEIKKADENFPFFPSRPYLIYQGALNMDRGIEDMIDAMEYLPGLCLLIAGKGDIEEALHRRVKEKHLENRVVFTSAIAPNTLRHYTAAALLGLSLEKDTNLNYHYCLPNKLFDYIQSEIPVLVSPLVEMQKIIGQYHVGECLKDRAPRQIALQIQEILNDPEKYNFYRQQTRIAKQTLNWDKEKARLLQLLNTLSND